MKEYGRIGQKRWEGVFNEEFLPELSGIRGVKTYREMLDNDDTIGAIMFAIKMLIRQVKWHVEPGGDSTKDREAAEFVESCMDDMQSTWTDTISEVLSFLAYGWSFHEIVYKRRMGKTKNRKTSSKYSDGLIGWQKIPPRAQDTLYRWEYDDKDNLIGMTQQPPPDYGLLTIPISKAMLFRTESIKDNPEGRSILRNAYRSWYFKRRIQEIEAIGIERDLAGLPVLHAPDGVDIWDDKDPELVSINAALTSMVKNIRRNEYEGLVLPAGYEAELLSTGGTRQFDTNAVWNASRKLIGEHRVRTSVLTVLSQKAVVGVLHTTIRCSVHRMQEQLIFAICTKHVRWEIFISGITIMRKIISTSIWRIMYWKNGHLTLSANLNGICCAVYNDFRY